MYLFPADVKCVLCVRYLPFLVIFKPHCRGHSPMHIDIDPWQDKFITGLLSDRIGQWMVSPIKVSLMRNC